MQALNELRYRLIEFRLTNGRTAEAQIIATEAGEVFIESLMTQRPALYIQLRAASGAFDELFTATAAPLPEFAVQEAVVALRASGSDEAADAVLRLFYEKMIAQRSYSPGYFLGLAELYLAQGAAQQAEAVLRRMTALGPEPYGAHLDASALLEKAGQTSLALGFASEKMRAEPWNKHAQFAVARLEGSTAGLAAIAGDNVTPYDLRALAAQQLAASGGNSQSLGSDELDLLARVGAAPTDPVQPRFYRARIAAAAAAEPSRQAALLAQALALEPDAPGDVRLGLFEAARAAGNHYRAVAALEPLLTSGTSLEFDSAFTENASQAAPQPWMIDSFLATLSLTASRRAEIATNLAESLEATERRQAAQSMLDIAIALEGTPARRQARQIVADEITRQVENARRRPRVGDHLDQPGVVRPILAAGGAQ
jgi:tetratricopeptide (TPR) repeat protein